MSFRVSEKTLQPTTWACRWQDLAFRPAGAADDASFAVEVTI
jgi:hypothetical protein